MNHYGEQGIHHYSQQALNHSVGGQNDNQSGDGVGIPPAAPGPTHGFYIEREGPGVLAEEVSVRSRFSITSESDLRTLAATSRPESKFSPRRLTRVISQNIGSWEKRVPGRKKITWFHSAIAIVTHSWINIFLVFLPFAWALHFGQEKAKISHTAVFALCFVTLMPLSKLLDFSGEQLALYSGQQLGDLIAVTLSNAVEAALALILLVHCELKLLQSTIIGVIILRLLLLPGVSFITGGVEVEAQELHPHLTQLNHTLLTIGSLTLLLPALYFAALDKGSFAEAVLDPQTIVNDAVRGQFLKVSRGLAIVLLIVYVASRYFIHAAPGNGEENQLHKRQDAPSAYLEKVRLFEEESPVVNFWACILLICVTLPLMAVTAQFLVESIEPMRKRFGIQEEWFGLILLPLVTFSADGILASAYYLRYLLKRHLPHRQSLYLAEPHNHSPSTTLAESRAIDLSIQFILFWLPLFILISWIVGKPLSLLFDMFEVGVLLGACFLVNYVTADAKTNWAEGAMMVAFYVMIALTAWFYPGQAEVHAMLSCDGVAQAVSVHLEHLAELADTSGYAQSHGSQLPQAEGDPITSETNDSEHSEDIEDTPENDNDDEDDDGSTIDMKDDGRVTVKAKDLEELMSTLRLLEELYDFL
ncbi:hypothetical protein ONZ45_g501 [Pleurotus djamor]|nr:hypothetical protein ONZ45_g501 [Pleurotus djamor]